MCPFTVISFPPFMSLLTLWSESCSVVSDSFPPHGLYSPWNSPGQNIGVSSFPFSRGSSQLRDLSQGLIALQENSLPAESQGVSFELFYLSRSWGASLVSADSSVVEYFVYVSNFWLWAHLGCLFSMEASCALGFGRVLTKWFYVSFCQFPKSFIGLESAFMLIYGLGVPELCKSCTFRSCKCIWNVFRDLVTHRELFLCLPEPLPESRFLATFLNQWLEDSSLSRPLPLWKNLGISPPVGFLQPLSLRTHRSANVSSYRHSTLSLSSGNFISLSLNMYFTFFIIVFYPRFLHLFNFWRNALPQTTVLLNLEIPSHF